MHDAMFSIYLVRAGQQLPGRLLPHHVPPPVSFQKERRIGLTAFELTDGQTAAEAGHMGDHMLTKSVLIELVGSPYFGGFYVAHTGSTSAPHCTIDGLAGGRRWSGESTRSTVDATGNSKRSPEP